MLSPLVHSRSVLLFSTFLNADSSARFSSFALTPFGYDNELVVRFPDGALGGELVKGVADRPGRSQRKTNSKTMFHISEASYTEGMAPRGRIPSEVDVVVIGAGFAGASVAAALTRAGVTCGLVLERELVPGSHASGRNAAMACQLETDPALLKLTVEGVRKLRAKEIDGRPVLCQTGGLYLIHGERTEPSNGVCSCTNGAYPPTCCQLGKPGNASRF